MRGYRAWFGAVFSILVLCTAVNAGAQTWPLPVPKNIVIQSAADFRGGSDPLEQEGLSDRPGVLVHLAHGRAVVTGISAGRSLLLGAFLAGFVEFAFLFAL